MSRHVPFAHCSEMVNAAVRYPRGLLALTLSAALGAAATPFPPVPAPATEGSDPLPKGASRRLGSARLRHAGDVPSVCFSPDGRSVLAGSAQAESAVYLWNTADGTRRHRLSVAGNVRQVAYSPDGGQVAAVTDLSDRFDRGVIVWEAATGKELHQLGLPSQEGKVCFRPDGKELAVLSGENELLLWRPGEKPRRLPRQAGYATALAFSPDGKRLAAGLFDLGGRGKSAAYSVCVWEAASGKRTHLLLGHEDDVRALAFTRDGKRLASGGWGETNAVRLWDLDSGKELPALAGRQGEALAVWLSPDDRTLLAADGEGAVRGWRLPAGSALAGLPRLEPAYFRAQSVAISADGKRLAMGSWYGSAGTSSTVKLWDLTTGRRLLRSPGHEGEVRGLAFTSDGKRLISCAADGAILWGLHGRESSRRVGPPGTTLEAVAISPDGSLLATGEEDRHEIRLFDTAGGKEFPPLTWQPRRERELPEREQVSWARFSPDGRSLAAVVGQRALVWRLAKNGRPEGDPLVLTAGERQLWPGGFSRDGKTLTVGTSVGAISWDAGSGKETARVGKPVDLWSRDDHLGSAAALSPDGRLLAVGGNAGALCLWDTAGAKEVSRLLTADDYKKGFRALAFSPDGRTLASGDRSGLIRFWDVTTRKEIARREGHAGMIRSLMFSPDGKTLASGSSDTTVLLWPVPTRKE